MKIKNKKIKKLINKSIKKNLMEMALRNITVAQKNKDNLFDFSTGFPKDEISRQNFNPQLVDDIKSTDYIKDYFSKSIVDIDVVILPEHLVRSFSESDYVEISKYDIKDMNSIFSGTKINSILKGKHSRYHQLIKKIMNSDYENAITLIMQSHHKSNLPFEQRASSIDNINNLSWGLHDGLGHMLQWSYNKKTGPLGSLLNNLKNTAYSFLNYTLGTDYELEAEEENTLHRNPDGDSEFVRNIEGNSPNENNELLISFRSDVLKFFKDKNFTKEVGYNDTHASICAWFVMNGKLPDPFYKLIYKSLFPDKLVLKFEKEIRETVEKLKGKAIILNFMDR